MSQTPAYNNIAIAIHWIAVALMLFLLATGFSMDDMTTGEKAPVLSRHASVGLLFFLLLIGRIAWRLNHKPGALPDSVQDWQRKIAEYGHMATYALMVLVPLTGLAAAASHEIPVMAFGAFDIRGAFGFLSGSNFDLRYELHKFSMHALLLLVLIHIAGSFYHLLIAKDGVFMQILPRWKVK